MQQQWEWLYEHVERGNIYRRTPREHYTIRVYRLPTGLHPTEIGSTCACLLIQCTYELKIQKKARKKNNKRKTVCMCVRIWICYGCALVNVRCSDLSPFFLYSTFGIPRNRKGTVTVTYTERARGEKQFSHAGKIFGDFAFSLSAEKLTLSRHSFVCIGKQFKIQFKSSWVLLGAVAICYITTVSAASNSYFFFVGCCSEFFLSFLTQILCAQYD